MSVEVDANPAYLLQQAFSLQGQIEYLISDVRKALLDDKLSPETRLVMVALQLASLDRLNDDLEAAMARASAALRQAVTQ